MNTYTFYWLDGKRQVLKGTDPADALRRAGYGQGALRALDFYENGESDDYEWSNHTWMKKGR